MAKDPKQIRAAYQKKYRDSAKYREAYLRGHLKRKYNLTLENYYGLLEYQEHVCAICKTAEPRVYQGRETFLPLFVDHCHETGKVRGLLCTKCNSGIGMFKDNIEYLISAISYLKENSIE